MNHNFLIIIKIHIKKNLNISDNLVLFFLFQNKPSKNLKIIDLQNSKL